MHVSLCLVFVCLLGIARSASTPCPNGEVLVDCPVNPCARYICLSPADLKCEPNYCGECTRMWYSGTEPATCWIEDVTSIDG
ncbi:hypothetical protein DPMN_130270 [Dreissena polymorpha]|uniref:Uncharacterized protein n=1 Tax=Dreissena polymorpha TaxID=45954 RepID=A0A9D4H2P8_DREPO|nr:hypothetical protein DPMN_130270 [Dreissena polymorpha]